VKKIPLVSPDNRIVGYCDADRAPWLEGVRLRFDRKHRVVEVLVGAVTCRTTELLDRTGQAFVQTLPSGRECFALRGVTGSR
jgi:hypothetical protein